MADEADICDTCLDPVDEGEEWTMMSARMDRSWVFCSLRCLNSKVVGIRTAKRNKAWDEEHADRKEEEVEASGGAASVRVLAPVAASQINVAEVVARATGQPKQITVIPSKLELLDIQELGHVRGLVFNEQDILAAIEKFKDRFCLRFRSIRGYLCAKQPGHTYNCNAQLPPSRLVFMAQGGK